MSLTARKELRMAGYSACFLFAFGMLLLPGAFPAAEASPPQVSQWLDQLPEGKAKGIVADKCQVCHTLERVVTVRRSQKDWASTVDKMVGYGAEVTPEEVGMIVDYLSANFGPAGSNSSIEAFGGAASVGAASSAPSRMQLIDPDQQQFSPAPDSMGALKGVPISSISGDPSKPGLFSVLLKLSSEQNPSSDLLSGEMTLVSLRGSIELSEGGGSDVGIVRTLAPGEVLRISGGGRVAARAKNNAVILVYGNGPISKH